MVYFLFIFIWRVTVLVSKRDDEEISLLILYIILTTTVYYEHWNSYFWTFDLMTSFVLLDYFFLVLLLYTNFIFILLHITLHSTTQSPKRRKTFEANGWRGCTAAGMKMRVSHLASIQINFWDFWYQLHCQ